MNKVARILSLEGVARGDIITLGVAVVITEGFFKFHSFTLEAVACVGTWCALRAITRWFSRGRG